MRNERTIAPERAARLNAEHAADLAARDATIKKLEERLAIASRRIAALMADMPTGIAAVDRVRLPKLPTSPLGRMAAGMKLPVA